MPSKGKEVAADAPVVIRVANLSKYYGVPPARWRLRGKRNVFPPPGRELALKDINLTVRAGELVGVIGRNGSGKSTLLKMIAGVSPPNRGEVAVNGSIFPMIELMAGMNPLLTGRENVVLLAAILGLTPAVKAHMDEIEDFCELGPRFDQPVETYSSGMPGRLGFAVSAFSGADIILVDEVLSTGDIGFRDKSAKKIEELQSSGSTILLVSHNLGAITSICSRAVVLDTGEMVFDGNSDEAAKFYEDRVAKATKRAQKPQQNTTKVVSADETEGFRVDRVVVRGPDRAATNRLRADERCSFIVFCTVPDDLGPVRLEIRIADDIGNLIVIEKRYVNFSGPGAKRKITVRFPAGLPMRSGRHYFALRLMRKGSKDVLLFARTPIEFVNDRKSNGMISPLMTASVGKPEALEDKRESQPPAEKQSATSAREASVAENPG